jgi:hypothetical protein
MRQELTITELDSEFIELLPERETLHGGNLNWANIVASNSSLALNAATFHSYAASSATQTIVNTQG